MTEPVPMTSSKPSRSRDRVGVKPVGCRREDEAPALRLVARDRLARARTDVRCDLPRRRNFDQRLELARMDLRAEQQPMVDLLQPRAVDQPGGIGQHRQDHERQEQQPPRRPAKRAMEQERRVGRALRHRPVHVVDGEIAHASSREDGFDQRVVGRLVDVDAGERIAEPHRA